jgi:hypothetical protein
MYFDVAILISVRVLLQNNILGKYDKEKAKEIGEEFWLIRRRAKLERDVLAELLSSYPEFVSRDNPKSFALAVIIVIEEVFFVEDDAVFDPVQAEKYLKYLKEIVAMLSESGLLQ